MCRCDPKATAFCSPASRTGGNDRRVVSCAVTMERLSNPV
jgi:hypothetical protein